MRERERRWQLERWISWIRVAAVPWAVLEVGFLTTDYPSGSYEAAAWAATAVLAAGAAAFFLLCSRDYTPRVERAISVAALVFDTAIVSAYAVVYTFEPGTPIRQLLFLPVVEAALRFGLIGGVLMPLVQLPILAGIELWRADRFGDPAFAVDHITFPLGLQVVTGAIIGWLVNRLGRETAIAETRAAEAEALRDDLGRRVDLLDAANRCARALGSSLELEQAFAAFIRELRGLLPFDRTTIVLAEDGTARVIAAAGAGAETVLPPGTRLPVARTVLDEILANAQPVYRGDMAEPVYSEETGLLELGLRCRVAVPLLLGGRAVGLLSVARFEPESFDNDEIELLSLLGRFLGSAVQNIRAYEAERTTAEELRRLSALRADFVSLVSHELRSPMAAVIGSAKTLSRRWRELTPTQRESFLALIDHETTRLAELVNDVLDTSRIEAGTFTYAFDEVDLGELVRQSAAAAEIGQDEVRIQASIRPPLPKVHGDRERLRQVVTNLVDNAVKYSPAGAQVEVEAYADNGRVTIEVRDHGPGVSVEHRTMIFEKFGRVSGEHEKQGSGLGLFIARSIAEAHGGSLEVDAGDEHGAVFTLALPVDGSARPSRRPG